MSERPDVSICLPNADDAPNYRTALSENMEFRVTDAEAGRVLVGPSESEPPALFSPIRIVDAKSVGTARWAQIDVHTANAPLDLDRVRRLDKLTVKLQERSTPEARLSAIQLGILAYGEDLRPWLERNLDGVFYELPNASLWLVATNPVLPARLRFAYAQFRLDLTPERRFVSDDLGDDPLSAHSLTDSVRFNELFHPLMLLFSPGTLGFSFAWLPHSLVLLYGESKDLRREHPISLNSMYEPGLSGIADGTARQSPATWWDVSVGEAETLLAWWAKKLSCLYWFGSDPRNFADASGRHNSARHLGWLLSVERILAETTLILSGIQADPLVRLNSAFDILDKLEVLAGYEDSRRTGKGFARLLRTDQGKLALRRAWTGLPIQMRGRFNAHTDWLYDRVHQGVMDAALGFAKRGGNRVMVRNEKSGELVAESPNDYVPKILRAVRNSTHGLLGAMATADRHRLATHSGSVPPELADLAALAAFAYCVDTDNLGSSDWFNAAPNAG